MLRRDALKFLASAPAAFAPASVIASPYPQAAPAPRKFEATWESIDSRPIPAWYSDAKFGIFIHWGVYSVPAFAAPNVKDENPYAEWYWNSLEEGKKTKGPGHGAATWAFHQRLYGAGFPYFDFAPMFHAELFDPDQWADLFAASGARYVALTSKHHEGFTLWKSAEANRSWNRPWNSVDIGPKRDLLLDLMQAGRRKNLHMGIYYSLYEWYNPIWLSDKPRFVREHMFPQFKDVVTHAEPDIIFSDGEWELTSAEWHAPELLAWLYNESPVAGRVVIDDRWGKDTRHKHGGYYTTEYTSGMQGSTHAWEENRGMGYSYGYNRAEKLSDYHSDRQLLLMLIDIVSRGGNLLLDIGPRADGGIPVIMEERLRAIGAWLQPNGEAIYGTHAWHQPAQWSEGAVPQLEQKDFRSEYDITRLVDSPASGSARVEAFFTAKDDKLYIILPRWPQGQFTLKNASPSSNARFTLLKTSEPLHAEAQGSNVRIQFPPDLRARVPEANAYVIEAVGVRGS